MRENSLIRIFLVMRTMTSTSKWQAVPSQLCGGKSFREQVTAPNAQLTLDGGLEAGSGFSMAFPTVAAAVVAVAAVVVVLVVGCTWTFVSCPGKSRLWLKKPRRQDA